MTPRRGFDVEYTKPRHSERWSSFTGTASRTSAGRRCRFLLTVFWAVWLLLSSWTTRAVNGYCLMLHAAVEAAAGIFILSVDLPAFRRVGCPSRIFLGLGHSVWALGDLLWVLNYFVAGGGSYAIMGIAVNVCCFASFVCLSASLLLMVDGSLRNFFEKRLTAISWSIASAIMLAMLVLPPGIERHFSIISTYETTEALTLRRC